VVLALVGTVAAQMASFARDIPDGALILRLDAYGLHRDVHDLFERKKQRVRLITAENPRPEFAVPASYAPVIDLGYAHGDACVWIDGYPIPILPASGIMQVAAYESVGVEAQTRGAAARCDRPLPSPHMTHAPVPSAGPRKQIPRTT